jgi:2-amino-4-ketopentanoate thiolase alpha subunit
MSNDRAGEPIPAGTWVEVRRILLPPGARAPQVPADTQRVPLELRVKGFLTHSAELGAEAEIETLIGRPLRGVLCDPCPSYDHSFGPPVPELLAIIPELRR